MIPLATTSIAAAAMAASASGALPAQKLSARVERPMGVPVFARPAGRRLGLLTMRTEWGSRRMMPVIAYRRRWLRVVADVPGRHTGWVRASGNALSLHTRRYAIVARRGRGTLTLFRRDHEVRTIAVAFGRPGSPTPLGRFAVTDRLSGAAFHGAYGCCILALSGHQSHLPRGWTGGDRLAIHATDRPVPAPSAGCVVATDADLRYLMRRAPLGTPVTIKP